MKIGRKYRIFLTCFIIALLIPTILYAILRSSIIQTYLTQKLTDYVAKTYDVKIKIGGVDFAFFSKLILEDVYIEDAKKDTLLYVSDIKADIDDFDRSKQEVDLKSIVLDKAKIQLTVDQSGSSNLDQIIAKFNNNDEEKKEEETKPWIVRCRNFSIKESSFSYREQNKDTLPFGVNLSDLELQEIDLKVADFEMGDTIKLNLKQLAFREKSGFELKQTFARFKMSDAGIQLSHLGLITERTQLHCPKIELNYNEPNALDDFINKVNLDIQFADSTRLSAADIAYFVPEVYGAEHIINLQGGISGMVNNLKIRDLRVGYGTYSFIHSTADIMGLPNIDETVVFLEIQDLVANKQDFDNFRIPPFDKENYLPLPDIMNQIGSIHYKASIFGLMNDFVAKGKLTSNVGTIITDIKLKPDTKIDGKLNFDGLLSTKNLNVGRILNDDMLGKLDMSFDLDGSSGASGDISAIITGKINSIDLNKNTIKGVNIDGTFKDDKFEGEIMVVDPSLKMNIIGSFDFHKKIPEFAFSTALFHANLFKLGLEDKDSLSSLALFMDANFKGNSLDNINGNIEFEDILYIKENKELFSNEAFLTIKEGIDEKSINFMSDIFDVNINGSFEYAHLTNALQNLTYKYLPSLKARTNIKQIQNPIAEESDYFDNITFGVEMKDLNSLLTLIAPELHIASGTSILGSFNSLNSIVLLRIASEKIKYADQTISNLLITTQNSDSQFNIHLQADTVFLSEKQHLDDLEIATNVYNDSIGLDVFWKNKKSKKDYNAKLSILSTITPKAGMVEKVDSFPYKYDVFIQPSYITLASEIWTFPRSHFEIDSGKITINDFAFHNQEQYLRMTGVLSSNVEDTINIDFNKIDMANLNHITESMGIVLEGELNGSLKVNDALNEIKLLSDINISDLKLNDQNLGNTQINSSWDDKYKKLHIDTYTGITSKRNIDITGDFYPNESRLDFQKVNVDFLRLDILQPFLSDVVTNLSGFAQGQFTITGTTDKPVVEGVLSLKKTAFTLNYLQTRYNFKNDIVFKKDAILFENLTLNPSNGKGGTATINGKVTHNFFSDFALNINLEANNFLFMDTKEKDNEVFYGKAMATGIVSVNGKPDDLVVDVSVKTNKNTHFFIPLNSGSDISETADFISFVNVSSNLVVKNDDYDVNLSGMQLNFNLQITPDAKLNIIMDEKVGDVITANGDGNISMRINTKGDFKMYGNYVIDKGQYTLNLKNTLSKKFNVEKGGSIKWNGDPVNALIDLKAVYALNKVKVYDLLLDEAMKETTIPVNCDLVLKDKLMSPEIGFDVVIPENEMVDERIATQIDNMSVDEMNKQFLALLIINKFIPIAGVDPNKKNIDGPGIQDVGSNAYELLTNQLNYWLSQVHNNLDIGVNKKGQANELNIEDLELAVQLQLFDDRVSVHTNFGMYDQNNPSNNTNQTYSGNVVGDFEVEYKITESGKLKAKYFAKTNEDNISSNSDYTQGIGIFYREDFDKWNEFFSRKKKKEKKDSLKRK